MGANLSSNRWPGWRPSLPSTWRQWASGVAAFRLGAATSRHAFAMMGSLPLPDLTTPGRGHLPGSRRYRWQGHHGGVRRPHHPDQTYKDRVLGPGGRLPGSFGRLIRTPSGQIRTQPSPSPTRRPDPFVSPLVLVNGDVAGATRASVPPSGAARWQGGRSFGPSSPDRASGEGSFLAAVRASASDRGSGAVEQQGERVTRSTSSSVRVAKAALATLERGQAVYAPPDGQRTADLNPAGAEVPT
jgi:hypothetical protein